MSAFQGRCRITVTSVAALFPQRVVVRMHGHVLAAVLDGVAGASCLVDEDDWEVLPQHWVGGQWRANVRNLVSDWALDGDVERLVIRSKDRDWPNDRDERNLILMLERTAGRDREDTRDREGVRNAEGSRSRAMAVRSERFVVPDIGPVGSGPSIGRPVPVAEPVRRAQPGVG
ncbi:hypothetical protein [Nocardia aurantia]|uniref:Uncharacterized protein n=1 Tax=Nocardia aurantia TaxID=2585199 RepID=A0A7K0DN81_9NOCA|nr:hypothetical protein [Nocardia aurantia]MQY27179.1 hypothetical protein [Nocardia aurantia]